MRAKLVSVALLFIFVGCSKVPSGRPGAGTLNPKAPKEAYTRTTMEVRNETYLSTVNVPVRIALRDVEQQINKQVNGLIFESNTFDTPAPDGSDPIHLKVWKRAPIGVSAAGGADSLFRFVVPLKIWAKAGKRILGFMQSADTEFEITLKFATRFSIDPNWAVNTQTTAEGYEWGTKPSVRLGGFAIPITGLVSRIIDRNLGTITKSLDAEVRKQIDLRTPVLEAWNTVRTPYLLSDQYKTWLQVVPRRVLITPLRFEGNVIRTQIGLEGYTLTSVGNKPAVKPAVSLPDLVVVPTIKDDFQVGILNEATYEEAAKLAGQTFVGKRFDFQEGRYHVTIEDIDLYGQNDNLIIKAGLSGSVTGNIYLKGRPYYDPETKTVALKDLQYDLETSSWLQRTASWLLKGTLARMLEKQFTIPVGDQITEIQRSVQTQLKNNQLAKGVVLNGQIDEIWPDGVYLTPTAILAVVFAKGKVDVKVEGLQ
ncbi:DUF4403 family protein [Rudanella paleaurantiibacter]|nr:DUF4403 family protein [Rudanella paleaurantiibacter]